MSRPSLETANRENVDKPADRVRSIQWMGEAGRAWYLASPSGRHTGPLSGADLREQASSGVLSPEQLLWHQGLDSWIPAGNLDGLFSHDCVSIRSRLTSMARLLTLVPLNSVRLIDLLLATIVGPDNHILRWFVRIAAILLFCAGLVYLLIPG